MSGSETTHASRGAPVSGNESHAPTSPRSTLRAAIIAYFVVFNVLAALPTPGEPSAERLQRPFEREELKRWARMFRAVGVDTDPDRLASGYLVFSLAVERVRAIALAPIQGWFELTQTGQNWHLFGTPGRTISALRITAHSAAGDEILYESGDPAHRWNAAFLEYRRIRAAYKPTRRGPPPTYAVLAERLSREVFEARPEIDRVTVAFVERRVRLPGESRAVSDEPRIEQQLAFRRPGA